MVYAVLADLKSKLGSNPSSPVLYEKLTDRTGGSTADDAVGQEILDAAHGTLDTYLANRYATPIDVSVDTRLAAFMKKAVLVLAVLEAYESHPILKTVPEKLESPIRRLISQLNRIADGKAALPGAVAVAETNTSGITGKSFGHTQQFTEDGMKDL